MPLRQSSHGAVPIDEASSADVAVSVAGAPVSLVIPPPAANSFIVLGGIAVSYNLTPAPDPGRLTIQDDGSMIFDIDIVKPGPFICNFPFPKRGVTGSAMTITLSAGGNGRIGKISLLGNWVELE